MKTKIISLWIITILILLLFSGCTENTDPSSEKSQFIGYWEGAINKNTSLEKQLTYTFYENDTYLYTIGAKKAIGKWEITEDNQLNLTLTKSALFNYTFADNHQKLTLQPVSFNFSYTLTKKEN